MNPVEPRVEILNTYRDSHVIIYYKLLLINHKIRFGKVKFPFPVFPSSKNPIF